MSPLRLLSRYSRSSTTETLPGSSRNTSFCATRAVPRSPTHPSVCRTFRSYHLRHRDHISPFDHGRCIKRQRQQQRHHAVTAFKPVFVQICSTLSYCASQRNTLTTQDHTRNMPWSPIKVWIRSTLGTVSCYKGRPKLSRHLLRSPDVLKRAVPRYQIPDTHLGLLGPRMHRAVTWLLRTYRLHTYQVAQGGLKKKKENQ
jgi:hypothetical protein